MNTSSPQIWFLSIAILVAAGCGASGQRKAAAPGAPEALFGELPVLVGPAVPEAAAPFAVHPTVETSTRPRVRLGPAGEASRFAAAVERLRDGRLPLAAAVRVEDALAWVGQQRAPAGDAPLTVEAWPAAWRPGYAVCRVRVSAAPFDRAGVELTLDLDPEQVQRYRLVGHEGALSGPPPALGGLPAGHALVVLLEVRFTAESGPTRAGPWLHARLTGRGPTGAFALRLAADHRAVRSMAPARGAIDRVVATLAEKLRGGYWARAITYADLRAALAAGSISSAAPTLVADLDALIATVDALDRRPDRFAAHGAVEAMDFDRLPVLTRGAP